MATQNIQYKTCRVCKIDQPIENFSWRNRKKGWRDGRCKSCYSKWIAEKRHIRSLQILPQRIISFFQRVEKTDTCWIWTGYCMSNGYGQTAINGYNILAHRFSYLYHFGILPTDLMVCHHCDNRKCVNPDHLFLGTASDNLQDMARKGRRKGERHTLAKLTEKDVLAIRANPTGSQTAIGRQYGVSHTTIGEILRRETWTHI